MHNNEKAICVVKSGTREHAPFALLTIPFLPSAAARPQLLKPNGRNDVCVHALDDSVTKAGGGITLEV